MCIYIYIYTHICMYIYIYIERERARDISKTRGLPLRLERPANASETGVEQPRA